MLQHSVSAQSLVGLPFQIDPSLPILEYFLEGEPIGVAIPQPGAGRPRSHSQDEDMLPSLEKRWCAIPDMVWQ
ncbi:MAG: hypothetical protein H7833_08465 [Magnetococcus sp. DMHC-1]|nr:hypothetical protein [Magnetococcales bacterium]